MDIGHAVTFHTDKIGYKYYNNRLSKDHPLYLIMSQ